MALVTRSYNQYLDAVIGPRDNSRLTWTWGFAETPQEVGVSTSSFAEHSDIRKAWFVQAIGEFAAVTNLAITQTESSANPQLLAGYDTSIPFSGYSSGATVIFNTQDVNSFPGTFAYHNYLHEIGHSMGLRHPADINAGFKGLMPADHFGMDYSVVFGASELVGGGTPAYNSLQSLGQDDIRALQYLWGANYAFNSADTVYSWDPITGAQSIRNGNGVTTTNKFPVAGAPALTFLVVWDGGGIDTYDLSNFTKDQNIDLRPGAWSTISPDLLPRPYNPDTAIIPGNVGNPYLAYDPDTDLADLRSLIENVNAGSGDDIVTGNQADNVLNGNAGNDALYGLTGRDTLYGGAGNDTLDGGQGADSMVGGAGDDTYYIDDVADIVIEAANGGNDTIITSLSISLQDARYANFENLTQTGTQVAIEGSASNNILTGNSANNIINGYGGADKLYGLDGDDSVYGGDGDDSLYGGAGNDRLLGEAGNDFLSGGDGADSLDGGTGNDTLNGDAGNDALYGGDGNDSLDGGAGNDALLGQAGNDSLSGGDGDDSVDGGTGDDALNGDAGNDTLVGQAGNDVLSGGDGADSLDGGAGNDALSGDAGNDTLFGGDGNDTLDGGAGDDTLQGGAGDDVYTFGIGSGRDTILQGDGGVDRLVLGAGIGAGDITWERIGDNLVGALQGGADQITLLEWFRSSAKTLQIVLSNGATLTPALPQSGTSGADIINGTGQNDRIYGLAGDDSIAGGLGDDTIEGGSGKDTMDGGQGNDTYYVDDASDVVIEFAGTNSGTDTVISSIAYSLAGANIENLTLTGTANINATGNTGANLLVGNDGDNLIDGLGGSDTMSGGQGNDTYYVSNLTSKINENAGQGVDTVITSVNNYTLEANIENLMLSASLTTAGATASGNDGANKITGNAFDNLLNGAGGDDTLDGGAGKDTLNGGAGNDYLMGGDGNDSLQGGDGNDTLDGGAGDDFLGGNGGDNTVIFGKGYGTDRFDRWAGYQDRIIFKSDVALSDITWSRVGQSGDLTGTLSDGSKIIIVGWYSYNTGASIKIYLNDGTVINPNAPIIGTANADTLTDTGASDMLQGLAGDDTLTAAVGDDTLDGGTGNDAMSGGLGNDLYYVDSSGDKVIELSGQGTDTVISTLAAYTLTDNVENLTLGTGARNGTGNAGNNIITGNELDNILQGLDGNDTLYGGDGNDSLMGGNGNNSLDGGAGNDSLNGGSGINTLSGGAGDDTLIGGDSYDTLSGGDGNDYLNGGNGVNRISGDAGNDTLVGGDSYDTLSGGDGNDSLTGGNGNNSLDGGAGNDTLIGGSDADTMDGGSGADSMVGGDGDDTYTVDNVADTVDEVEEELKDDGAVKVNHGSDTVIAQGIDYSLQDKLGLENLILVGSQKYLTGNSRNNILTGNDANNIIDGGEGADRMIGGKGDDIYYVDSDGDRVVENVGEGYDVVYASVNVSIETAQVEDLVLTGTSAVYAKGNDLANRITGNSADNILIGGAGVDTMVGGAGNDLYYVEDEGDIVRESAGQGTDTVAVWINNYTLTDNVENLTLVGDIAFDGAPNIAITGSGNALNNYLLGNGQNNALYGFAGNDTLDGGYGADTLYGGIGDDIYYVDNVNDVVIENRAEGIDTIITTLAAYTLGNYAAAGSYVENLTYAGASNFTGVGNLYSNVMKSGAGEDNLSAGQGDDTVYGGAGDDTIMGEDGADQLFGEDGNDSIYGGAGNDELDGGAGDDYLSGGLGDDTYTVGQIGDTVVELAGQGTDTVISSLADYKLTSNIEKLKLTASAVSGSGNDLDNIITGNDLANKLYGMGGSDSLIGGAGADTLDGGEGSDTLIGGTGNDALYGGAGDDVYAFNRGDGIDTINDDYRPSIQLDGGQDKLLFGATITQTDLWFSISGSDLIVGVKDPANPTQAFASLTDKITLKNWFNTYNRIETIQFTDGSTLTARQIVEKLATSGNDVFTWLDTAVNLSLDLGNDNVTTGASSDTLDGGGGNDTLNSGAGDDTLVGGLGNDTLYGGLGNDVYVFNRGDGVDTIYDDYGSAAVQNAGADVLSFGAGILKTHLAFTLSGADLVISVSDPAAPGVITDKITLKNWTDPLKRVETLRFNDGATLDAQGIAELLATTGNDTLTWTETAINRSGGAGNDKITTGAFNDTLNGGAGNDTLDGGAGYDIATFTGAKAEYTIAKQANGSYIVTDKTAGRDGADTLSNIEALKFSDGLFKIADLTPVANTTPTISSPAAIAVAENVSPSTVLYQVTAFDPDPGSVLTYSIATGADKSAFSIDPVSGAVRFVSSPNYEIPSDSGADHVYNITIQASDGTNVGTQAVSITVTNIPEIAPSITSAATTSTDENLSTSTAVYKVTGADSEGASLTYSLTGGADKGLFSINATTGDVTFLVAPDYENPSDANRDRTYDIEVAASNGVLVTKKSVAITLNNVDDAPSIVSTTAVSFAENSSTDVSAYRVVGVDPEGRSLTYSLSGGADKALFNIDPNTGSVRFNTAPDFEARGDSDQNNVYQIEVQASDGALTTRQTVAITVTDVNEAPVITSVSRVVFRASDVSTSTQIYKVTSFDPDALGTMNYTLYRGRDTDDFNIDNGTGVVTFKAAPNYNAPADAGANNIYDITVSAYDGKNLVLQDVAIVITNEAETPPVVISDKAFSVAENIAITDAAFTVRASDPDPGAILTYAIAGGPDKPMFVIDGSNGDVRFSTSPDAEKPYDSNHDNVYEITVQVSDGTLITRQSITITVTDRNDNTPVLTSSTSTSVAENVATSVAIYTVSATDADITAQLTYAIVGGADQSKFSINASSGAVSFLASPDFESQSDSDHNNVYSIIVQASDGTKTATQTVAITLTDVNEFTPVLTSATGTSVAENIAASDVVYMVRARDADLSSQLTYAIVGGADQGRFSINASSGAVSFLAPPDFESQADSDHNNVYAIIVQASDGTKTATQTVAITLTDVNEYTPVMRSPTGAMVAENVATSDVVYTVSATDSDLTAQLTYTIVGGADRDKFSINTSSGAVNFKAPPDFESRSDSDHNNIYAIIVQASDGANTATRTVSITLSDVNEYAPVMGSGTSVSVAENMGVNEVAYTVRATDGDTAATLTYSIVGGADQGKFKIDASSGEVSFLAPPDFESMADSDHNNIYDIIVQASDGSKTATRTVAITLTDVNENAPVITSLTKLRVAENASTSVPVYTVAAIDNDPNAKLTYAIVGGADQSRFTINGTSGAVSFLASPDYERRSDSGQDNVYDIIVQASDGTLTTTKAIAISLTDVNEHTPVLTSPTIASVAENVEAGYVVYTVSATDMDLTAQLTYAIVGGADQSRFSIDGVSGAMTFNSSPDYERPGDSGANNVYDVIVRASDGTNATTQALAITITDVNDNAPVISSGVSANVAENVATTTAVYTVAATDADTGGTALTYSFGGGSDDTKFSINGSTGAVTFKASPNYEVADDNGGNHIYNIIVRASDGTNVSTKAVAITLTDVNDNKPVLTSLASASVAENVSPIVAAYTVTATDQDTGTTLTYSLSGGLDKDLFLIDSSTGAVTFKTSPDYENPDDVGKNHVYDIVVQASDGTNATTQAVAITLADVNEDPPFITSAPSMSVSENVAVGFGFHKVAATHAVGVTPITYSISGGVDKDHFKIDAGTGALSFSKAHDYERPADNGADHVYDIVVQASDGAWTDSANMKITLTNGVDNNTFKMDFDGDAKGDLLFQNARDGACVVWQLDGLSFKTNGFAQVGPAVGTAWQIKATGDFNGDTKSDFVFQNAIDGSCYIWEVDGLNLVDKGYGPVGPALGTAWKVKATGDFNGDGKSDLLFQNAFDGACVIWQMDGLKIGAYGQVGPAVGTAWQIKTTGDFNGDGKSDFVFQNANDGTCFIWEIDGLSLGAYGQVGPAVGAAWQIKATGDFNGDGKSDLLFQNANDGACAIWQMDGLGIVGYGQVGPAVGTDWQVKGATDVNGDGKSDILFQNARSGACYVWEMDGLTLGDHGQIGPAVGTEWLVKA